MLRKFCALFCMSAMTIGMIGCGPADTAVENAAESVSEAAGDAADAAAEGAADAADAVSEAAESAAESVESATSGGN